LGFLGNRGCDMEMRELKTQFDLGRTRFVFYSPRDRDSMKEVIADADVVVNMMGKYFESGQLIQTEKFPYLGVQTNFSYEDVNVKLPKTLAEICTEMQVDHFIHVSSASASPTAKSVWSRTKYEGELAVKEAFPWATIIRPTQLYGKDDRLLNWFAKCQQSMRCVPLIYPDAGKEPLIQPVYVGDVARAIRYVCEAPAMFEGRQIDCFGPDDFTYPELAKFVNDITEQNKPVFQIPKPIYEQMAKVLQYIREPLIVPDLVNVWTEDFLPTLAPEEYELQKDNANKILTLADLSIEAKPVEKDAFGYLQYFRAGGHYFKAKGYHMDIPVSDGLHEK